MMGSSKEKIANGLLRLLVGLGLGLALVPFLSLAGVGKEKGISDLRYGIDNLWHAFVTWLTFPFHYPGDMLEGVVLWIFKALYLSISLVRRPSRRKIPVVVLGAVCVGLAGASLLFGARMSLIGHSLEQGIFTILCSLVLGVALSVFVVKPAFGERRGGDE